jgi:hypothetical protein
MVKHFGPAALRWGMLFGQLGLSVGLPGFAIPSFVDGKLFNPIVAVALSVAGGWAYRRVKA